MKVSKNEFMKWYKPIEIILQALWYHPDKVKEITIVEANGKGYFEVNIVATKRKMLNLYINREGKILNVVETKPSGKLTVLKTTPDQQKNVATAVDLLLKALNSFDFYVHSVTFRGRDLSACGSSQNITLSRSKTKYQFGEGETEYSMTFLIAPDQP